MGEGIKLSVVHKKCGKKKLIKYGGGDVSIWCEYCKEWLKNPEKEVRK